MFGLSQFQLVMVGAALAVVLAGGAALYIFNEGKSAGTAAVTGAVQSKTIETMDRARETKERADSEVRATPYSERVDGLR